MRKVDGVIAVTDSYHEQLRRRYPWIRPEVCRTIPFGASQVDFDVAAKRLGRNSHFDHDNGRINGLYVGVLGRVMHQTCLALCLALQKARYYDPELVSRLRLHFIGTDYSTKSKPTIQPLADAMGLGDLVRESPRRIQYFTTLNLLKDADFLLLIGSDNPEYTASKLYPYILARRPLFVIFHEASSLVQIVTATNSAHVVTYSSAERAETIAERVYQELVAFLKRLPFEPDTVWEEFNRYSAHEMTRRQCELFDRVVSLRRSHRKNIRTV